jgi:hypothetical protein
LGWLLAAVLGVSVGAFPDFWLVRVIRVVLAVVLLVCAAVWLFALVIDRSARRNTGVALNRSRAFIGPVLAVGAVCAAAALVCAVV